jgi:hypothetical protein
MEGFRLTKLLFYNFSLWYWIKSGPISVLFSRFCLVAQLLELILSIQRRIHNKLVCREKVLAQC